METTAISYKKLLSLLENTSESEEIVDWAIFQKQYGFETSHPPKPELPKVPKAPVIPPAPHEDDASYGVELGAMDKLLPSRRRKKENAALQRFERDRKRWNDNRLNALAHYEFAKKNYAKNIELLSEEYAAALKEWRQAFASYLILLPLPLVQ